MSPRTGARLRAYGRAPRPDPRADCRKVKLPRRAALSGANAARRGPWVGLLWVREPSHDARTAALALVPPGALSRPPRGRLPRGSRRAAAVALGYGRGGPPCHTP